MTLGVHYIVFSPLYWNTTLKCNVTKDITYIIWKKHKYASIGVSAHHFQQNIPNFISTRVLCSIHKAIEEKKSEHDQHVTPSIGLLFTYVKSQSLCCVHTYLSNIKRSTEGVGRSLVKTIWIQGFKLDSKLALKLTTEIKVWMTLMANPRISQTKPNYS